jgi:hypothetical protein
MTEHIFHTLCEDIAADSFEILEGFCVESEEIPGEKERSTLTKLKEGAP